MRLYSRLVERCFNACAQDFTSKALTTNEVSRVSGAEHNRGDGGWMEGREWRGWESAAVV